MEDEELEPVNCAVAVRAIKDAGIFMLLGKIYLQRVGDAVVANGTQVLSLMQDTAWKENSFIVQEEGKE